MQQNFKGEVSLAWKEKIDLINGISAFVWIRIKFGIMGFIFGNGILTRSNIEKCNLCNVGILKLHKDNDKTLNHKHKLMYCTKCKNTVNKYFIM